MRVAAVQMCSGSDVEANLAAAQALLRQAADGGAELVTLPENFACYGGNYRQAAEHYTDILTQWLREQAHQLGIHLVAGSIPLVTRPDGSEVAAPRVRAASVLVSPEGRRLARYDKLHLFDVDVADQHGRYRESSVFEPGAELVTQAVSGWQLGMAICYDLRFPMQARALADRGAELLLYPSAFTAVTGRDHWHTLLRARAIETGCYVLAANQCGRHSDTRVSYGHSALVDPWGDIVAELDDAPGVLVADIDRERLGAIRSAMPLHEHQRFAVGLNDD